jgi:hypothetical protein
MKRVYKIQFIRSSYELNDDYESMPEQDKDAISGMLPGGYFEYNDQKGRYALLIILSPKDCDRYSRILDDNLIAHSVIDISPDVLKGADIRSALGSSVNPLNRGRWTEFSKKLDEWALSEMDIDMVLDRINEVGMPNLSKIEKRFLNTYKPI